MRSSTFHGFGTINLGSGERKIDSAWNVDAFAENCDEKFDLLGDVPSGWFSHFDRALLFHTVEHIEKPKWGKLFANIWDMLQMGGTLIVSYPEFEKVALNWINNAKGMRAFWEATIYGRQLHDGDYHVALMCTPLFTSFLAQVGFVLVNSCPEDSGQEFNTVLCVRKVKRPLNYEQIINKEIFA